jgi:hypothetical protein
VIVDVEGVLVGVDHDEWRCHPEYAHRMFVADDVVKLAVDWVLHQHGPASGFYCRGDKVGRPFFE